MSQTNILLEAGTNELEIVEFFLDEPGDDGKPYRGYYGVNVAKVLEIIQMPKITSLPEVQDPSVLGAFPWWIFPSGWARLRSSTGKLPKLL